MINTVGMDIGSNSVKAVFMSFDDDGKSEKLVETHLNKIRRKDPRDVVNSAYQKILQKAGVKEEDLQYVATTGEGDMADFRTGHFYSMTAHSRGALFLNPEARAVVDAGALHSKALVMDHRSKVLRNRMTSQCASGSGQFIENISRYLGVTIEDVGRLSLAADNPEVVSGICAVLAETDVINMVSRGISPENILKGIHLSMARRLVNLLRMIKADGVVLVTGGLSQDEGLVASIQELAAEEKRGNKIDICSHELSGFAGAIGAAIWGAFRHVKLAEAS